MKSKLSANELFHFTKFDRLINIIKEGFYPRYNFEHIFLSDLFNTPSIVAHIPMVCFCDIPLRPKNIIPSMENVPLGLTKSGEKNMDLTP